MKSPVQEPEPMQAPSTCPFCRSTRIAAPAAKVDASSYWRCEACGQMWNADRIRSSGQWAYAARWDR